MSVPSDWHRQQEDYWDKQDKRRSPTHPAVVGFAQPKVRYVFDAIKRQEGVENLRGWSVLDVGCGNGYFTHHIPEECRTVGLDFAVTMLKQNPAERLVCGSTLSLPFADQAFDVVICSNLLHHIDEPLDAVKEMKRVSRHYVALSEPNCGHLAMAAFHGMKAEERGALKFNLRYLSRLMDGAGLQPVAVSAQGSVLPNKCPPALVPFFRPLDRMPLCRLYCVALGKTG